MVAAERRWSRWYSLPACLTLALCLALALYLSLRSWTPLSIKPSPSPRPSIGYYPPIMSDEEMPFMRLRRQATPDFTSLIDLKDFRYTLLPRGYQSHCRNASEGQGDRPLWLAIVSSAPNHFYHRKHMRLTWAAGRQVVFLLGKSKDAETEQKVEEESRQFGDILQGSFLDTYRNLTYKHVMGLRWAGYGTGRCNGTPTPRYILKIDDDTFVNTAYLDRYLSSSSPASPLILCPVIKAPKTFVHRSYRSKWRVRPAEYKERYYPPYCAGWVVLYSADVVRGLHDLAQSEPYFWIDDVHVTGTLAKKLNVTQRDMGELALSEENTRELLKQEEEDWPAFIFSLSQPKNFEFVSQIVSLQERLQDRHNSL